MLGLEEACNCGRWRLVQPFPDGAHGAARTAFDEALYLLLVADDRGQQLACHVGSAGKLRPVGQEIEELDDDRVEHLLRDGAELAQRKREALHVPLTEGAQKSGSKLRTDRSQDDRRLFDRRRPSVFCTRRSEARPIGTGLRGQRGSGLVCWRTHDA